MNTDTETARDLLNRAESYLSALHGSVGRHDQIAANLACAGCELRDQIAAELGRDAAVSVAPPAPRADDQAAVLREADEVFALDYDAMVGEEGDENLGSMREAWDLGTVHATLLLRRLADAAAVSGPCVAGEEQQNETPEARQCACPHPPDEHSVYGCADGCGCEWMPKRATKEA